MCTVHEYTAGLLLQSVVIYGVDIRELQPDDLQGCLHHLLQVPALNSCAAGLPHSDAVSENALDDTPIEVDHQFLWPFSAFLRRKASFVCF